MGGQVTVACLPLDCRIGEAQAIGAGWKLHGSLTAVTLFNDRVARPSVKLAPFLIHEKTLKTLLYSLTNHGYHILSSENKLK